MTCKSFFYKSVNCKFFSVGECGDQIFPAIYAKLDDPEIFYFIEGAKEIGVSG